MKLSTGSIIIGAILAVLRIIVAVCFLHSGDGKDPITKAMAVFIVVPLLVHAFIDGLAVSDAIKDELKAISPQNYVGK